MSNIFIGNGIVFDVRKLKRFHDDNVSQRICDFLRFCRIAFEDKVYWEDDFVFFSVDAESLGNCKTFVGAGGDKYKSGIKKGQPTEVNISPFCVSLNEDELFEMIEYHEDNLDKKKQILETLKLHFDDKASYNNQESDYQGSFFGDDNEEEEEEEKIVEYVRKENVEQSNEVKVQETSTEEPKKEEDNEADFYETYSEEEFNKVKEMLLEKEFADSIQFGGKFMFVMTDF